MYSGYHEDDAGWENNKTTNPGSEWGGWGQKKPDNNDSKDAEASWGKDAGASSDTQKGKDCLELEVVND